MWAAVLVLAALVFALDFASKRYVEAHMHIGEVVPVLPGVFDIAYIRNSGAAFSLLEGRTLFLVVVTFAVLAAVLVYGGELLRRGRAARIGLALVVGGAAGNLWDRLTAGGVADFLHLHHWPVFNVADSAVVVGGALIAWTLGRSGGDQADRAGSKATGDAADAQPAVRER
ncbi:MAG: signal peptidase II [Clostridia bacterium]|nr:signal peptidase II [Clostridia bacterium]